MCGINIHHLIKLIYLFIIIILKMMLDEQNVHG